MKILLATDSSEHSKAMIRQFSRRSFAPNTKLRVIYAYERAYMVYAFQMGILNEYNAEAEKFFQKSATAATENAATTLRKINPKLAVSTAVIEGSPKAVILEEAEKFGANLIVVGSHGHSAVAGFLLGSVSQAVALHAKCSVEIVRIQKTKK